MPYRSRHITKEVVVASPAAKVYVVWRAPVACKVSAIRAYRIAGTGAVVKALKNATDITASNLSLTSADTWMAATLSATAANKRLAAGDTLKLEIVSVAGTPTDLTIQAEIVLDANAA
jgi:hypothetical protein